MTGIDENLRKKLLFRATHRGFKEADILVGSYVSQNIDNFTKIQISELEAFLSIPDNDIYDWYMGKTEVPEDVKYMSIISEFLKFRPSVEIK